MAIHFLKKSSITSHISSLAEVRKFREYMPVVLVLLIYVYSLVREIYITILSIRISRIIKVQLFGMASL